MKTWLKSGVVMVALLAMGAARLPFELKLRDQLRASRLAPPAMVLETREHIDQTSAAVALGGLRTLVASFLNLRAYTEFTERRWGEIEQLFQTMVNLAPRTRYYWETGAWHLAYNAAAYYLNDSELSPLRRREAWRSYIFKGRAFLERGIRNNPDDWHLRVSLGSLLSDSNKFVAFRDPKASFTAAADAYQQAAASPKAPAYVQRARLYALARIAGAEPQALALARSLYAASQKNRTPTLVMLLLVLEAHEDPSLDVAGRAIELFGSPERAYTALSNHWQRTRERFPVFGVAGGLEALERMLAIPPERSVLRQPLPPPPSPDDWFPES